MVQCADALEPARLDALRAQLAPQRHADPEQAKQWLAEDAMPIHCIAERLGFSETASFRHAFVRWSGVAPSQFRP